MGETSSRQVTGSRGLTRRQALATMGSVGAVAAGGTMVGPPALADEVPLGGLQGSRPEFWNQHNNMHSGKGIPPDFFETYDRLDQWEHARRDMDGFVLRANGFNEHMADKPEFLAKMAAAHAGMSFGLNVTQPVSWWWDHYKATGEIPDGPPDYGDTLDDLRTLRAAGIEVTDVIAQSVLTKPGPTGPGVYTMDLRVRDTVAFFDQLKPEFPDARIGLIFPMTNTEYYPPWWETLTWLERDLNAAGHHLEFLHFDKPFDRVTRGLVGPYGPWTWDHFVQIQEFVQQEIGAVFGLQCVDAVAGQRGNNQARAAILDGVSQYVRAGGRADRYILNPFHLYPDHTIPDDLGPLPPEGASQMRIFRELANGVARRQAHPS